MGNPALTAKNVRAPAKLNVRLKVTGRRADGYHELVSLMVPVGLFDHIELTRTPRGRIILSSEGFEVPNNEENLAYRAAQSFFALTGIQAGLSIRLVKNIPVAAGLGGGSSDAAATLKALNEMWGNPVGERDLAESALRLGADVPFFLQHGPCIARGIGEILEPVDHWPKYWYVVVKPPLNVSTAWVYGRLKLKLTSGGEDDIVKMLKKERLELDHILANDLEAVTASHFPVIHVIKEALRNSGAEGALMSGSGPSVFGVFDSREKALGAKDTLRPQKLGDVFAVEGMT